MVQVTGCDEHDAPTCLPQAVQPLTVLGELTWGCVPQPVVFQSHLARRPGEVHAGHCTGAIPDPVLGNGHRQGTAADQEPQPGLLRRSGQTVRERTRGSCTSRASAGAPCGEFSDSRELHDARVDDLIHRDDGLVEREKGGNPGRCRCRGRDGQIGTMPPVLGRNEGSAHPKSADPSRALRRRHRQLDVVERTHEIDAPQHRCTETGDHRRGQEEDRRPSLELVSHFHVPVDVDTVQQTAPARTVQLSRRQKAPSYGIRAEEDVAAELGRNHGRRHAATVPGSSSLARSSIHRVAVVHRSTPEAASEVDLRTVAPGYGPLFATTAS